MKDKQISEEELLEELDTMYQRVADIEKEEAAEAPDLCKNKTSAEEKENITHHYHRSVHFFYCLGIYLGHYRL